MCGSFRTHPSNVEIPTDVILCKDCNCNNVEHKEALNKYNDDILFAITSAGQNTIKTRNRSNGKNLNRPGWNEFASEQYDMSRETYALWKNYRHIALASIVSKVLEKIIYDRIAVYLTTCSNQLGVRAKHSTDMTMP